MSLKNLFSTPDKSPIELSILPDNWRSVGIKNGMKDAIRPRKSSMISSAQSLLPTKSSKNERTNWSDLRLQNNANHEQTVQPNELRSKFLNGELLTLKNLAKNDLQGISQNAKSNLGAVSNSGLGIKFELPEGVDIDELNQSEMILYSFRLRVEDLYVNALTRTYQEYLLKNPHILALLERINDQITLTGNIKYNSSGSGFDLALVSPSGNKDLNNFFNEVLKRVNQLPNPPGILFKKADNFSLSYSLIIKR